MKKIVLPNFIVTAVLKMRFLQQAKMLGFGNGANTFIAPFMDLDGTLYAHLGRVLLAGGPINGTLYAHLGRVLLAGEPINSDCDEDRANRRYG